MIGEKVAMAITNLKESGLDVLAYSVIKHAYFVAPIEDHIYKDYPDGTVRIVGEGLYIVIDGRRTIIQNEIQYENHAMWLYHDFLNIPDEEWFEC